METVYVNLKSELTVVKSVLETIGFNVYRTRTECNCSPGQNRRDALIAIHQGDESYNVKVIRCKTCTKGGQL